MKQAWKELVYGKKKYILIELLLVLLMFMVLFLSGLAEGLGRAVSSGIEDMDADYYLLDDSAEDLITVSSLNEDVPEKVKKQTTALTAPLDIQRMYLVKEGEAEKLNVTYFAIEPDSFIEPAVMDGVGLADSDVPDPIILDDDFLLEGIALGDTVYDSSSDIPFTVTGFAKDQMYGHVSIGFISTDTYAKIRKRLSPMYTKMYHAVAIKGDDIENIGIEGTEVISKEDIISSIPSYTAEHLTITMIVWVLIVISAVIIGIFHYILTLQKRKQFGIMKALGMSMGRLVFLVISEVAMLSVSASVISLVLAFGMAGALPETMPFYLETSNAVAVVTAFVLISIFSSILSILNISRIDPITAIGGGEE
ncbi:MAG: ABC transporter permease [Lachnospiraceae bacterium]|nr:ABC transporter permease [Lachnospiraceae bacterium]